ncbi:MAG: hypothetical protein ABIS47_08310 [Acidimicrobiales bacterium]
MDWSKLDPALAAALDEAGGPERHFVVFIHLHPDDPAVPGVVAGDGAVRTATVTADEVESLSHDTSVRALRLATRLRATEAP